MEDQLALPSAFHITRIENLAAIWAAGFLMCDEDVLRLGNAPATFAYQDIKDRRRLTPVTAGHGGSLSDYVPFYFCHRSPMLATVYYSDRENGTRNQERIAHLRIDVRQVARDLPFAFSDGHGIMALSQFYADLARLDQLDWAVINGTSWSDTFEQPDRKRRKQAEFLVHSRLPLSYILEIGVKTARAKAEVEFELANIAHRPPVNVRQDWYYW